jgi:hypothetical protein
MVESSHASIAAGLLKFQKGSAVPQGCPAAQSCPVDASWSQSASLAGSSASARFVAK